MKLVIDRSRWRRGCGPGVGLLRDSNKGLQCCLGFFGAACGVRDEHLVDVAYPQQPRTSPNGDAAWPEWLFSKAEAHEELTHLAIINDSPIMREEVREERIAERFARHGVEVEFVDGPVSP